MPSVRGPWHPELMTRFVFVGAGAIGGSIGALLTRHREEHGSDVVLVARGKHAEALRSGGALLRTAQGEFRVPVEVASGPGELELTPGDVLVFATKTPQAAAALAEWADRPVRGENGDVLGVAGELLPAVGMFNGLEATRIALRYFRRVYGAAIAMPADYLRPGEFVVRMHPVSGAFFVGRFPPEDTGPASVGSGMVDGASAPEVLPIEGPSDPVLAELARAFRASTLRALPVADVLPHLRAKLLVNLANSLEPLVGTEVDYAPLWRALRSEAQEVYRAAGLTWAPKVLEEIGLRGSLRPAEIPGAGGMASSTWQSIARGTGSIETDFFTGEIAYLARAHRTVAPLNELVTRLCRESLAEGKPPGWMTPEELRARFAAVAPGAFESTG